ncbi:hypothetical protein ABE437_14385 [Isoptericola cucumis]|uniref:hypothetical protein n=1 Tax=Isoptericola cucumis TaxID=1776856 RepID=UPI00320A723E
MKRILGAAVVAVLAAGAGLGVPAAATAAVPSGVVTSKEFAKVAYGNSISYVRSTFGSNGKVVDRYDGPGTADDYVRVEFPTYYAAGTVEIEFLRRSSGTWYLVAKYALWGNTAKRTADKATQSEFHTVKQGNTITHARKAFGTSGTITEVYEAPGTKFDGVVLEWPTASVDGWVQVYFTKSPSGTWKVDTRSAYWAVEARRTADKATEAEFDAVRIGNSLDHARSTFGTGGTIGYSYDAPGTVDDATIIGWPTASPDGYVELELGKRSSGAWAVAARHAYWAVPAKATTNPATEAEYGTLRDKLANGYQVSLSEARGVFGSAGTVVYRGDGPGTDGDQLLVHWYTGTDGADVLMNFVVSGGTWTALTVDDIAGPWSGAAARRSLSSPEPSEPAPALEREQPERPSWDLRSDG